MMFFVIIACFAAVHGDGIDHEDHKAQPYSFGYTIKDKEGVQHRQESSNGAGEVKGSYGFYDNKGIKRQVNYVADHGGFRAQIKTNEPGTSGQSPAAVNLISNDPYAQGAPIPYVSRPNVPYVPALYISDGAKGFPTVHDFHKYTIDDQISEPGYTEDVGNNNVPNGGYGKNGQNGQQGGTVYFGANLVGGVITGMDSRFTSL